MLLHPQDFVRRKFLVIFIQDYHHANQTEKKQPMKTKTLFFVVLLLSAGTCSYGSHFWLLENETTAQRSLLVDLNEANPPTASDLNILPWTGFQTPLAPALLAGLAPAASYVLPLANKKPELCDCEGKRALAAFFQDDPLTPEEELAIKAEVDAHADTEWWNNVENPGLYSFGICESPVNGDGYQTNLNPPTGLVNIQKNAHKAYNKAIDPDVPVTGTAEGMSAKQVYIGKVFFQKYILKQKCQIKDHLEYQSLPERQDILMGVDGMPIIYADLFNPNSEFNFISRLSAVEYDRSSSRSTVLNNYFGYKSEIQCEEVDNYVRMLCEIVAEGRKKNRPSDRVILASRYLKEFEKAGYWTCRADEEPEDGLKSDYTYHAFTADDKLKIYYYAKAKYADLDKKTVSVHFDWYIENVCNEPLYDVFLNERSYHLKGNISGKGFKGERVDLEIDKTSQSESRKLINQLDPGRKVHYEDLVYYMPTEEWKAHPDLPALAQSIINNNNGVFKNSKPALFKTSDELHTGR